MPSNRNKWFVNWVKCPGNVGHTIFGGQLNHIQLNSIWNSIVLKWYFTFSMSALMFYTSTLLFTPTYGVHLFEIFPMQFHSAQFANQINGKRREKGTSIRFIAYTLLVLCNRLEVSEAKFNKIQKKTRIQNVTGEKEKIKKWTLDKSQIVDTTNYTSVYSKANEILHQICILFLDIKIQRTISFKTCIIEFIQCFPHATSILMNGDWLRTTIRFGIQLMCVGGLQVSGNVSFLCNGIKYFYFFFMQNHHKCDCNILPNWESMSFQLKKKIWNIHD